MGADFDFMFLLYAGLLENPIKIINGRIVSARVGIHTLRDSYAILPTALKAHKKEDFDYRLMHKSVRDKYRNDILFYLAKDCEYLHEWVISFIERRGLKLTAASMAFSELKKTAPQKTTTESYDAMFREYFYGGRVECIKSGIISAPLKVYDVNSMYPFCMREFNHPKGSTYVELQKTSPDENGFLPGQWRDCVYFSSMRAISDGALPYRTEKGLSFPTSKIPAEFYACSHEIQAGIKVGRLRVLSYGTVYVFPDSQRFETFVDKFMGEKLEAEECGDKDWRMISKLTLNSAYGKFGMDSRKFKDYLICDGDNVPDDKLFVPLADYGDFTIWNKPTPTGKYNNVAIAASITSAARATLMLALSVASNPVYCDTDSIICEGLDCELDEHKLGAWKLEAQGDSIAIAGKKMYALMRGAETVKLASKGVRLDAEQIFSLCKGAEIVHQKESPVFKLTGQKVYLERRVRATRSDEAPLR